jgi:hypothetical protein
VSAPAVDDTTNDEPVVDETTPDTPTPEGDGDTKDEPTDDKSEDESSDKPEDDKSKGDDEDDGGDDKDAPTDQKLQASDITLPEGLGEVDEAWMGKLVGLDVLQSATPEQAQEVLSLLQDWIQDGAQQQQQAENDLVKKWEEQVASHQFTREAGADEVNTLASAARDTYFAGMEETLGAFGVQIMDKHPIMKIGMAMIARDMQLLEANPLGGGGPIRNRAPTREERMFPKDLPGASEE